MAFVADVLGGILADKAIRLQDEQARESLEHLRERALERMDRRRPFVFRLQQAAKPAVIAEIKRASPSAGVIASTFDPQAIARDYETAGADAISVLTEQDHFYGDLSHLDLVRAVTTLPLLRKDFVWTPYQVAQSAAYGADCVLLIAAALGDDALNACLSEARAYNLDALVEVHNASELRRAAAAGADLIGVNNRDLRTLQVDLSIGEMLLPDVPAGVFAVAESGVRTAADAERLRKAGADAFLVGEALMRCADPVNLLRSLR